MLQESGKLSQNTSGLALGMAVTFDFDMIYGEKEYL